MLKTLRCNPYLLGNQRKNLTKHIVSTTSQSAILGATEALMFRSMKSEGTAQVHKKPLAHV